MDDVTRFRGVVPGPACVIPEEKRIFRVTGVETRNRPEEGLECGKVPDGGGSDIPLPVPHMYSA